MRALVLSGGAVHGAYQVGAIKYLIQDLGIKYDILCGVSVGALNCSYLSMFSKEDDAKSLEFLLSLWANITDSKIKKRWFPFGVLHGLWLDSVYNSQPLINMVRDTLNLEQIRKAGRNIAVGAVSLTTGNYKSFTQNDDAFIDGVLASSSYPMGLKTIMIKGEKWTDGGVKHIVPIQEAIDFGATELDIVICSPEKVTAKFNDLDAVTLGMRCFDLMTDQLVDSDIKITQMYNQLAASGIRPDKKVLNLQIIRPTKDLDISPLSFDNVTINKMIAQGYSEAKMQFKL